MIRNRSVVWFLIVLVGSLGCGGNNGAATKTVKSGGATVNVPPESPVSEHSCAAPITEPAGVWKRIEAARRLPEDELLEKCGLDFVVALSEWRTPPIDLLEKIVAHEAAQFSALEEWVRTYAASDERAVEAVVAMDIIAGFEIGHNPSEISRNRARWQPLAAELEQVRYIVNEALALNPLLAKVEEIHQKRCMLEVNPLGFAMSCTPIHPARQKIDLRWREEVRDGLIVNLELSKCSGSASCKELKRVSREFLHLYLKTVDAMESLRAEVFKERLRKWLQLPSFSHGVA